MTRKVSSDRDHGGGLPDGEVGGHRHPHNFTAQQSGGAPARDTAAHDLQEHPMPVRRLTISSAAFEDLIRRLPAYVDVVITADATHKYAVVEDVTYVAPLEVGVK